MNRDNLETLAAYLEGLPADYQHFNMNVYVMKDDRLFNYASGAPFAGACGTVACAVGHGPAAGIPAKLEEEWWTDYARRVFELKGCENDWCFAGLWVNVDNTPHGAAKRIRYLLDHGLPEDAEYQMYGDAPYLFAQEEAA
jgi:hypothetical protein